MVGPEIRRVVPSGGRHPEADRSPQKGPFGRPGEPGTRPGSVDLPLLAASGTMSGVGKHQGEPVEELPQPAQRQRLLALAAGLTATVVAWGYLVFQAIEFGSAARDGAGFAWVLLLLATVGATACLFVTLILGSKILMTFRGELPPPRPKGPPGGRRAAR